MASDLADDTRERASDSSNAEDPLASGAAASAEAPVARPLSSQPVAIAGDADSAASMNEEIDRLLREQKTVRDERKRVAAELKNAQRRRKRLKHRARLLSSDDLARVLALRAAESATRALRNGGCAATSDNGRSSGGARRSSQGRATGSGGGGADDISAQP